MPRGTTESVHVHSLLHCNLNTGDLASASSWYSGVLGLTPGMKTARVPSDGRVLGVPGKPVTETWFMYDHRGPRAAPAIELLEWESPATAGEHPREPNHIGLSCLGYAVPSVEDARARAQGRPWSVVDGWPVRGRDQRVGRILDLDGVPVELLAGGAASPVFSHLRINCTDLDASTAWYSRLGFTAEAVARSVRAPRAGASRASPGTRGGPALSLAPTPLEGTPP